MKNTFFLLFFVFALFIVGCEGFSLTPESTQSVVQSCATPEKAQLLAYPNKQRIIVILIEGSKKYEKEKEIGVSIIQEALVKTLKPGDRIIAIWTEITSIGSDNAVFFDRSVEDIPYPNIQDEPIYDDATIASVYDGSTGLDNIQFQLTKEAQIVINEKTHQKFFCDAVLPIRQKNNELISQYNSLQTLKIYDLINSFISSSSEDFPNDMGAFESIQLSSDIFRETCNNERFSECNLIVISDLKDHRASNDGKIPKSILNTWNVNLDKVKTSIIWPECEFFSDSFGNRCESRQVEWNNYFKEFGVKEGNIQFLNKNNSNQLTIFLGGDNE